ncbi:MAG: hypothetical protein JSW11_05040 [Candidatus Heimdallarchaeota archaeon]|nr:MAG: hypothetical protein JSW11_05040 [Candidatus Heimdallarchaeota archaeon]
MNSKSLFIITIQIFLLLAISINTFPVSMVSQDTTNLISGSVQLQQPPKSITIINGMDGKFEPTFHPMYDTHSLLLLPFDTLVEIDPVTNEVIPSLAKQWVAIVAAFEMILDPTKLK